MGHKGDSTKNRIIAAACHLFKYQGYRDTTIDHICKESGVKRGNLYFHFASKEELACEVLESAYKREWPYIERITSRQTDPLSKIYAMMDGMGSYIIQRGCKGG
ncbi:MAG: TetR/AcrR family transcriptional regulator [Desulfatiglans sp.]|jgi:AcrR family transcriptional regulator|nr:TetR/AcrR family transcriptional regulator [Thermodesulfobacteriota bacterium]MEE4352443.1 TetR/AcrR family transcriptional regulator [Desulfatiglans sp.]